MRARITYVAVVGALAAVAACSSQEKPASTAQPAAPAAVTIHAKDFAYVAPDTVPAGFVTFTLINDGPSFHHATIFRLDSGKTMSDLAAALKNPGPPPAWAVAMGGPNAPDPGNSTRVSARSRLRNASSKFSVPSTLVLKQVSGASHDGETKLWAPRWKISCGSTAAISLSTENGSASSHRCQPMRRSRSAMCSSRVNLDAQRLVA